MWFSTAWKYIQNPSQSPSTRTHTSFRHLHFPTKKAPANQVTDAFVNIIIPVQNNLSSQVPHPGPPSPVTQKDSLPSSRITGATAIFFIRLLNRSLKGTYTTEQLLHTLKDITFADIEEQGFMPVYERQEITDDLHETCGFRTDYPFIAKRKMKRSFFLCLLPRLVNVFEKNPVMKRECEKT